MASRTQCGQSLKQHIVSQGRVRSGESAGAVIDISPGMSPGGVRGTRGIPRGCAG